MVTDEQNALRRLLDKDSIVDLVHRYSYCVDHRLYDEVVDLFTEDCTVDYGPVAPPVRTRTALRQMFGHPAGGFEATSHHNANVLVTFEDDDRATVRTSVYAWHEQADGVNPRLWGYYHDWSSALRRAGASTHESSGSSGSRTGIRNGVGHSTKKRPSERTCIPVLRRRPGGRDGRRGNRRQDLRPSSTSRSHACHLCLDRAGRLIRHYDKAVSEGRGTTDFEGKMIDVL